MKPNRFVGKRFFYNGAEMVVTWNDKKFIRFTPVSDKTGLTSIQRDITEVVVK